MEKRAHMLRVSESIITGSNHGVPSFSRFLVEKALHELPNELYPHSAHIGILQAAVLSDQTLTSAA